MPRAATARTAVTAVPSADLGQHGPQPGRRADRARHIADQGPGDARVYLGIILPVDGGPRLRRRKATASRHLAGFGVAMYCGFGRQPGKDGVQTMRDHRQAALAARE